MARLKKLVWAVLVGGTVAAALASPAAAGSSGTRRPIPPGFSEGTCWTECRRIYYPCPIQNGFICSTWECKIVCS